MTEFSVVIPAYNAENTIEAAVRSAREVGADDIIVVDDGSTDKTYETASQLGCSVVRQLNSGAAQARLTGLKHVTTEYTVFLDSDDHLMAPGVRTSLELLAKAKADGRDVSGAIGRTSAGLQDIPAWPEGVTVESMLDRGRSPGPPAALVWATETLKRAVQASPPLLLPRYAEDFELILRGARAGTILSHSVLTCTYTTGDGKSASQPLRSMTSTEDIRRYYGKHWSLPVRQRGMRELRTLARYRKAFTSEQNSVRYRRIAVAVLADPVSFAQMLGRRVRR